jgi:chitin synthase
VFITIKSVQEELDPADKTPFKISDLVQNSIFFTLIVSLLSTYVLWIVSSIVFLDPWHIVTSVSVILKSNSEPTNKHQSLQYMLLTPTYTNVINVYAFCNTHDVTWGTKGDDKPPPLASAKVNTKTGEKTEEPGLDNTDLDILYTSALSEFSALEVKVESKPSARDVEDGYNKAFRSYVVLAWMFCNAALVAVVLNVGGLNRLSSSMGLNHEANIEKTYLMVILWSVAGLSGFKFVGAMWYRIHRVVSICLCEVGRKYANIRTVCALDVGEYGWPLSKLMALRGMRCTYHCSFDIVIYVDAKDRIQEPCLWSRAAIN